MINLLPPEHRTSVEREYKFRLASAYILLISIAIFIGVVLLLPSYFFASTQERVAEQELAILESSSESVEREAINTQLRETKERLINLTRTEDKEPVFALIDTMSSHKQDEVSITNISYSRGNQGNSLLSVGGVAATRDALLDFKRALETDTLFEEIELPVSSLAKEEDIQFSIQIKGAF